jgi:CheY-like chemotaxis protein
VSSCLRSGARRSSSNAHPDDQGEFFSPNAIGRLLGITGVAVKQWIYRRRLRATKMANGYWRVAKRDLDEFLIERSGAGRQRVLLVGRNAAQAEEALGKAGWNTTVAHNPVDAVLKALDSRPALTVIDVASLGDAGWAAARKLRDMRSTVRIPMLLLVETDGQANGDVMERSVELGAQGCLCLPVPPEVIARTAQELMDL